jgi:hypothetical protein
MKRGKRECQSLKRANREGNIQRTNRESERELDIVKGERNRLKNRCREKQKRKSKFRG